MGLIYKDFNKNISKDFQKAVNDSAVELANMKLQLTEINVDKVVTQEESDALVTRVGEMADKAHEALESRKEKVTATLKEVFSSDGTIDEAEQKNLEIITRSTNEQISEVDRLKEEVKAILQKKVEEQRELSEQEIKDVEEKIARIKEIELLGRAETKEEVLLAQNEFNERVKNLDLKGTSELLAEKAKARDEELISIKSKYDTAIQIQKEALENASEEDKANIEETIKRFEKEKQDAIDIQNEKWQGMYNAAVEGNENIKNCINKYTGEILTNEDKELQQRLEKYKSHYQGLNEITESGVYQMYNTETKSYQEVAVVVDETTGEIIGMKAGEFGEIAGYSQKIAGKNIELMRNYNETKEGIKKAVQEQTGFTIGENGKLIDSNGNVQGSLKGVTQSADGTTTALVTMAGKNYKITINNGEAKLELDETKRKIDALYDKDVYIRVHQTTLGEQTTVGSANGIRQQAYATGTNNFPGGFTWMHEQGYELYNLPSGSKIYNHDASEAAVKEMVSKVFEENMKKLDNGGSSLNLNIENFYNNRKQDVKALAEELEFYRMQQAKARGHRT